MEYQANNKTAQVRRGESIYCNIHFCHSKCMISRRQPSQCESIEVTLISKPTAVYKGFWINSKCHLCVFTCVLTVKSFCKHNKMWKHNNKFIQFSIDCTFSQPAQVPLKVMAHKNNKRIGSATEKEIYGLHGFYPCS